MSRAGESSDSPASRNRTSCNAATSGGFAKLVVVLIGDVPLRGTRRPNASGELALLAQHVDHGFRLLHQVLQGSGALDRLIDDDALLQQCLETGTNVGQQRL